MKTDNQLRVIILGGSGFVGPAIVKMLLSKGAQVTLLNRGSRLIEGTTLLKADRNVASELRAVASGAGAFNLVIDLSCYTLAQAQSAWEVFASKTARWIHLSSAAVYSVPPEVTPSERDTNGGAPVWGEYGRDKSAADQFLLSRESGPQITILRPPYLYGPGNDNDRETFVWSRALRDRSVLVPGDGTTPIQFLHVEDLARLCFKILGFPLVGHKIYNVAADEQINLKDYVRKLARICGKPDPTILVTDLDYGFTPRDYFPFRNYPCRVNPGLIKHELSWTAEYDFELGFTHTYKTLDSKWLCERPLATDVEDKIIERLKAAETLGVGELKL